MDHFEELVLNSKQAKQYIKFWYRYVDDILICFDGTSRQLESFLDFVNTINNKIQFTLERECDREITFLDLRIKNVENKFIFDIFRKPTFTDTTIPVDSVHPSSQKLSSYYAMIYRALTLPLSNENLEKELNTIKIIATNNGFESKIINQIKHKVLRKLTLSSIIMEDKENDFFRTLTYFGKISEKIAGVLRKQVTNITFKPAVKLGNLLINNKDRCEKNKKSGVYKLTCQDCQGVYIGQTGRSFETRKKEHWRSLRLKKSDSTFANHLMEEGHKPSSDMKILHVQSKGFKLDVLEAMEVYKNKKESQILLNEQTELFNSRLFPLL